ncbi:MAG TPA: endonuclease/exonuclease/phosphatase family protein [Vicinamibacterales bacterium]
MIRCLLPFVTLVLLVWSTVSCARNPAPQGAGAESGRRSLRVMTFNIRHGQTNAGCDEPARTPGALPAPDCGLDLSQALDVIRAHAPDIVGLQEVDRFWARSAMQDQPALIAKALDMPHTCYGANLDHQPDEHSDRPHQYGTLVLSRLPILECTTHRLPRVGDAETRGLTRALVDVRGARLQFFNTHFHTAAADRRLQAPDVVEAIDTTAAPVILVGDFNAVPDAGELAPLFARFRDAWREAAVAEPDNPEGATLPVHPSDPPRRRIDYVFVSEQVTVRSARVPVDAKTRLASDHYPIVVEVEW